MRTGKRRVLALVLMCALASVSACSPLVEQVESPVSVYATFYPIYALADLLVADVPQIALSCLVQPQDGCLRAYSLSDWDIYLIAYTADAVLAGGGGLESFEETLYAFGDAGPAVATATYGLSLYNEDDERAESDEETSHLVGANPHLYLSVSGAGQMLTNIANALVNLAPSCEEAIGENLARAQRRLQELREEMQQIAGGCAGKSVILMNEALIYPAQDLGLVVDGWYDRESGYALYDNDLAKCLETIESSAARVILIEKQVPDSLVSSLEAAGYSVARIDILSTGREDMGASGYFDAQLYNARAIAGAFERVGEGS